MDSATEHTQTAYPGYTVAMRDVVVPMDEFIRDCVRVFKAAGRCALCERYSSLWSCPPYQFAHMELWQRYKRIRLFARILTPSPDAETTLLLAGQKQETHNLLDVLLKLEAEHSGSLALSAGCCTLCEEECTRPTGRPCRNQKKMRCSIESLGGDVAQITDKYFHIPPQQHINCETTNHVMLVGGLLLLS